MKVLPLLQQAFPSATGYENLVTVIQANAEGHLVKIQYDDPVDDDEDDEKASTAATITTPLNNNNVILPSTVFVKQVDATYYAETKSSWTDLRRTLMYCRTEVRFYNDILPELIATSSMSSSSPSCSSLFSHATPQIYLAQYDLDGILTESEGATDPSRPGPVNVDWMATATSKATDEHSTTMKGGYLIMEGMSQEDYFQDSPITMDQAKQTLAAIAGLHASAWEDQTILTMAQERLSRGSYHLKTRNPKELANMSQAWDSFVKEFQEYDTNGIFDKCGPDFGRRIQNLASYICENTSPGPTDPYATVGHGDFKSMNCFLPKSAKGEERGVVMVDFASVGVGLGMQDVAMHIHHAVHPSDLANGGEMELVDHYLTVLNDLLRQKEMSQTEEQFYPQDVALRHYQLSVVDYFRFFLGRFWKSATPESFAKKKDSKNTALINRDMDAAFAFLERAYNYVNQIELEKEADTCSGS
jgi:hypothetical protein